MKKKSKKRIIILILLIFFIIVEIIAFNNSRANRMIEMKVNISDTENIQAEQVQTWSAISDENGLYITLPEYINNIKVQEYYISRISNEEQNKENEIVNNIEFIDRNIVESADIVGNLENSNNTDETDNINDTNNIQNKNSIEPNNQNERNYLGNKENENITGEEILTAQPGSKLYLTKEEEDKKILEIQVKFDNKEVMGEKLYYKMINVTQNQNEIQLKGYMPKNARAEVNLVETETIKDELDPFLEENVTIEVAYDIKILDGEKEYNPSDYNENIEVLIGNIKSENKNNYKVIHIEGTNSEEIEKIEEQGENIAFTAKEFSVYVVLAENNADLMLQSNALDAENATKAYQFGSGTETDPYLISTVEELSYLAEQVNSGNSYENTYFQLASNIDLENKNWTPIGNTNNSFRGIFDGAGHSITNITINVENIPTNSVDSYGLFGSLGGGNSKTIIRNLEINNMNISIEGSGNTANNTETKGLHIGTLAGTIYRNTQIINNITKNSTIRDNGQVTIYNSSFQYSVGGLVGYATDTLASMNDPGEDNRYEIRNCFVNADITLDNEVRTSWGTNTYDAQYQTGGIIGTIRSQPVWPEDSLYTGSIDSNGFIGPIFGTVMNTTSYNSRNNYSTWWNGNGSGNATMTSYYSNFTANSQRFTATVTSGNSTNRISNSSRNIGYVQGVNKGRYTSNISNLLENFNSLDGNDYMNWKYENSTFSLVPRFNTSINEENEPTYVVEIENEYSSGPYTYTWYLDGNLVPELENQNEVTQERAWDQEYNYSVLISDGEYYSILNFTIERLSLYLEFDINEQNDSVTARLEGEAANYVQIGDYNLQWYMVDIVGISDEKIDGETNVTLNNLEEGQEYKLIATHKTNEILTVEGTFVYRDRNVIYVDYNNGSNRNNGYTPETPVQTLSTAYGKLESNVSRSKNIIVIMGEYSNNDYFTSQSSSTYNKNVTITGMYDDQDYNAVLRFEGESSYKYMNGDTTFMYLTFDGTSEGGWFGQEEDGSVYFYLQGYSLTMGEGIVMENYVNANENQGLLGNNAPAFHIICGWLRYNYATLPRNNAEILIKSGTYGRIIGGGSPGTTGASNLQQNTSHNFMGSSMDDSFNIKITINIQNSTTPSEYDYDVNLLVGGSACGNNYSVVTENVMSGSIGRLLGGSIGDSSDRPNNWRYPINTFLGETTINISGGTVEELYGGCLGRNMNALGSSWNRSDIICDSYFYGTITLNMIGGEITGNIYGAGAGGVTGYSENSSDEYKSYGQSFDTSVNLNISGGIVHGNIYGGGYGYTEYLTEDVTADDGGSLYGDSYINISGSPTISGNIYAAGCGYDLSSKPELAQMEGNSNIQIEGTPTINGSIFGAGAGLLEYEEMAKLIGTSNITINSNLTVEVYGGGNNAKTEGTTNINIESGNHTNNIYGGGNIGIVNGITNVYINGGVQNNVLGGGNQAETTTTNVYINGGNTSAVYGGGNLASVNSTNVEVNGGNADTIYGGSNQTGTVQNSKISTNAGNIVTIYGGNNLGGTTENTQVDIKGGTIQDVYGGNNLGGTTTNANVNITSGEVTNVYGGGDQAITNLTNVFISGTVTGAVYGGGNRAGVNTDTNLTLENAVIAQNVFGGGNEGTVSGNTNVRVKNSNLASSLYSGGNGTTAVVYGNTNLTIEGNSTNISKNVFGGGNKAATGTEENRNSVSTVNIVGGDIGGNVYGGANTSVVYGVTKTNIGYDTVNNSELEIGNIHISGTVFGGGEANESGSEIYDFSFISVTDGINIEINGNRHEELDIDGSIFGSGNASSTSGESYINIQNYGTPEDPKSNISIQRANCATINNSAIALAGATDRTNEYSDEFFTISRVDTVKLKNNSTLYLNYGANLLTELESLVDENGTEIKGAVTIDDKTNTITRNVDNRIYMAEGRNLNIATNEQVTAYGQVHGMIFLGLFTNRMNPSTSTGLYNYNYQNGDEITNEGTFSANSYAMAQHMENHDTSIDGFYTNYNEDGIIQMRYIETTPADDVYYIWMVGEQMNVTTFELSLTASKYATLGTYELSLMGFSDPNITFDLVGFSAGLDPNTSLINPDEIEAIALDEETANNVYGLTMEAGKNGWQNQGETIFLTDRGGTYEGSSTYKADNSTSTPTLNFCLFHSTNITEEKLLGDVRIRLQALVPVDDLNYAVRYIDINITMTSALYPDDYYEAAITPGEEYGLFTSTTTSITKKSAFSTYYSLYIDEFSQSEYYSEIASDHRVLISRDANNMEYALPENTRIVMLDLVTGREYYYVVTAEDVRNNKFEYQISDFIAMGSTNEYFNEEEATNYYYNEEQDILYENFIFHIKFSEANITEDVENNNLLIELRNDDGETLLGVLGIQRDVMEYSVYDNRDATINVSATATDSVYLGEDIDLQITTDFKQEIVDSKTIYDTEYFEDKMGIMLTFFDNNGNQLALDSLFGISFELDGQLYYPRIDGTTRIKIADKVSNVLSRIKIHTQNNSTIATGTYTIQIESFGSPDGIYYGLESSAMTEAKVTIINSSFGLNMYSTDNYKVIDKETGNNLNGTNSLVMNLEYSSGLENPIITVSLYRRDYSDIYSQEYQLVDLADYVLDTLDETNFDKEYLLAENPGAETRRYLRMKSNLITGTYKLVYKLYDGNNYIGEDYEYVVIE